MSKATGHEELWVKEFFDKGGSSDYVRAVGDLVAESKGAMYDYEEEVVDKSMEDLERDKSSAMKELVSYKHHPLVAVGKAPPLPGQEGISVEVKRSGIDKDWMESERITRLIHKLTTANEEIGRRMKYQ